MADLDPRRLVLVRCTLADGNTSVGTGYLVKADLLLTASHVVPVAKVAKLSVRVESDGTWCEALTEAVWRDADLDAVLFELRQQRPDVIPLEWTNSTLNADARWHSIAFPTAGLGDNDGQVMWKTVGLGGTLYAGGGGGQGSRQLDLGVEHAPSPDLWSGASGAPIFTDGGLAGIIKQVPPNFRGDRLIGVPTSSLLNNLDFRIALASPWLPRESLPKARAWVLVIQSEAGDTELGRWVDGTLQKDREAILEVVDPTFELQSVKVRIAEAIESPARWLSLVKALCLAPIAIFDATDFEPAVMLALGVRAVVRRGVTITSTARELSEKNLANLPFNMKETKLIHHGDAYELNDYRHPYQSIAAAIKKGWHELRTQRRYLDLPAYDGVRCPHPASSKEDVGAVEQILMLCPFRENYARNWRVLSSALAQRYPRRAPTRMLDVTSPRLVGQALYEGIRWSRTCIVDWTSWRANVFFEFGVRLASASISPVCLIDEADQAVGDAAQSPQKRKLMDMWRPTVYRVSQDDDPRLAKENRRPLLAALEVHDEVSAGRAPSVPLTAVPHDATYRTCRQTFEWVQEGITIEPQEILRRSVVEPFGPDPQYTGVQPILFAADNPDFSLALEISIRERWVAAWFYLSNRYPREQWSADFALRAKVYALANQVLQFGLRKNEIDPLLIALRDTLYDVIDEIDDMDG